MIRDRLRRARGIALSGAATALLGATAAPAATELSLGTATPGGGFEVYGQTLAGAISESDPSLRITTRSTRGSSENLVLLARGEVDLALVEGNAAHAAFREDAAALRIVAAMYPNPGMFVVRADSPYQRIDDLKGRPVAFGTRASGLVILARDVLDGLGLTPERDFEAVFLERAGDGPQLVLDGRVAALWGGGLGWPGFRKVAESHVGARFIAPSPAEIARIRAKHPFLKPMTVPAGTYAGQERPIESVGLWAFVLARASLPDEIAYRFARALHRAQALLAARLPQAAYTTAANTAAQAPRPELIHPGARRYLEEAGIVGQAAPFRLAGSDVDSVAFDAQGVFIKMTPDAAARLLAWTSAASGGTLSVTLDGEPLLHARVAAPVSSGVLQVRNPSPELRRRLEAIAAPATESAP